MLAGTGKCEWNKESLNLYLSCSVTKLTKAYYHDLTHYNIHHSLNRTKDEEGQEAISSSDKTH